MLLMPLIMENNVHARYRPILVFALLLAALPSAYHEARAHGAGAVALLHVHGITYNADGKRLIVAVHDGMAVYSAGRWSKDPGPRHDYMGFSATKDGFYSSGHPAPGSGLRNPFGLIRSTDGGKSWAKLSLEGESDFHLLGSYAGAPALLRVNWKTGAKRSLTLPPMSRDAVAYIAQNPANRTEYAVATFERNVYITPDGGRSWKQIARNGVGQ